jgi:hypothetical protein
MNLADIQTVGFEGEMVHGALRVEPVKD